MGVSFPQDTLVFWRKRTKCWYQNKPCLFSIPFSHHGPNPSLNIRTERHLCGVDVTDLPGLPLTKAKVSLARPTQWPFNQAGALLRTREQCYFLSQNYKDRVLQETWQTKPFRGKCFGRLSGFNLFPLAFCCLPLFPFLTHKDHIYRVKSKASESLEATFWGDRFLHLFGFCFFVVVLFF